MKKFIALTGLLLLSACHKDYGNSIGRATRPIDLEAAANCSYYISAVKPSNGTPGFVKLTKDSTATDNNYAYFLCSYGQCSAISPSGESYQADLPFANFDLPLNSELALVIDGEFQNPDKICSYLYWQEADNQNSNGGLTAATASADGSSDSDLSDDGDTDDGNSDSNLPDDGDTDDGNSDSDLPDDGDTDDGNSDTSPQPLSAGAAVVAGRWQNNDVIILDNTDCTLTALTANPVCAADWNCQ